MQSLPVRMIRPQRQAAKLGEESQEAPMSVAIASLPSIEDVVQRVRQSVLSVRTSGGFGSATAWRADGLAITNAHVASESQVEVATADGETYAARVVRRDATRDLALLQVDG